MKLIDGDFFESISDLSFGDMYTKQTTPTIDSFNRKYEELKRPLIAYIETHRFPQLLNIVKNLSFDVVLITHNSDYKLPNNTSDYLGNNIIKVWSQNYSGPIGRVNPLPIGLERKMWFPERNKQGKILELHKNKLEKNKLFYCNFNLKTNKVREVWYKSMISHDNSIKMGSNEYGGFDDYIKNLATSKFIISPPGNGIDCHRNWESLYVGSVPVIEDNNFNRIIFDGLPHLLIDDVSKIYQKISSCDYNIFNFNSSKLSGEYWEKLIKKDVK